MAKPTQKQLKLQKKKEGAPPLRLVYSLIILLYGFITVVTPNLYTFDSNGPKFLSLAILNLLAFVFLLTRKDLRTQHDGYDFFFRNKVGFIYFLFLVLTLLSFVKAINIFESIIMFAKIFTVFTAAYIISIVLRSDKRYLTHLAFALSFLLIADGFTVFYHIFINVMEGKGPNILEIKSVYSNKNILAASLFVKIPFALWLFSFKKGWLRILGIFSLFIGFLGLLFLSARAFYIGSIILFLVYVPFLGISYYRKNEKRQLLYLLISLAIIITMGFVFFTFALKHFYPKSNQSDYNFITRLKTAVRGEPARIASWGRTVELIKENPLLGVGTGNWKVAVLKYENPLKEDYVYLYKTHNDFLEIASETGVLSGLLYISIFLLIFTNFIRAFSHKEATEQSYAYLFLPAFGLLCYSFDAFFNFPLDRPEIGSLFAIYVGAGIAFSSSRQSAVGSRQSAVSSQQSRGTQNLEPGTLNLELGTRPASRVTYFLILLLLPLMLASIYVLMVLFNSLHVQRIAKEDLMNPKLMEPTGMILRNYPLFPNLSMEAEPIVVSKARYLFRDNKYAEAVKLLKADRSSPYDTRPEFFAANAYFKLDSIDSSLVYNYKVYKYKPLFFNNILNICRILEMKKRYPEAIKLVKDYTEQAKTKSDGYLFGAALCQNGEDLNSAIALLDSGAKYLPDNGEIREQQRQLHQKALIGQFGSLYDKAQSFYKDRNFSQAAKYYTEFITKVPDMPDAYMNRAFCYFFLKAYKKSLADVEYLFAQGIQNPALFNLRGVNYQEMGNTEAACMDFEAAMKAGNQEGEANYAKFCGKTRK
jgi:putative inorganic carbon (hco3(-)) transporter